MGIRFNEIEPVLGFDQNDTRLLAQTLCSKRNVLEHISFDDFESALTEFDTFDDGNKLGLSKNTPVDKVLATLHSVGWIQKTADGFILTQHVLKIAAAVNGKRMTFNETCDQIMNLISRLENAPSSIDGIMVNRVLLYGSSIRDKNENDTIGDLDMLVDMGFDARYQGKPFADRSRAARSAWSAIISNGDERVGFFAGIEECRHLFESDPRLTDSMGNPRLLLQIWKNNNPVSSVLSSEEIDSIKELHARTVRDNVRACAVHEMIQADFPVVGRPGQGRQIRTIDGLIVK